MLVVALVCSTALSGCATTLGYVKDHPDSDPKILNSDYGAVKTWAHDVSDGYSSRGTINRYSLYWGSAIAAAGIGTLGGLAVTGSSGNASVIIPLAATFIGTLFGYYHNEELAQIYYSASDSINAFVVQSEKRYALLSKANLPAETTNCDELASGAKSDLISKLTTKICADLDRTKDEKTELIKSRDEILQNANALNTLVKNKLNSDTLSALGKAVDEANAKIAGAQEKIDLANKRKQNLELVSLNNNQNTYKAYEAGCLNEDVDDVMHRVRIHLSLLDPQHVSEDLKNVKTSAGNANNASVSATLPATSTTAFNLSDLDPKKMVSACDVGL